MIDLSAKRLVSMSQAADLIPGRPSLCALWRWRTRGVRGRRLEAVPIGGRTYTSIEALQRFAAQGSTDGPTIRTPAARERAIARAERELSAAGV